MADGDNTDSIIEGAFHDTKKEMAKLAEMVRNLDINIKEMEKSNLTSSTPSRILLKAKRRVVRPPPPGDDVTTSGQKVTPPDLPPTIPVKPPKKMNPPAPLVRPPPKEPTVTVRTKQEAGARFSIEMILGKSVRETLLLQLKQFNSRIVWDKLRAQYPTEHNLCSALVLLATELNDQFYAFDQDTAACVLGLPGGLWNKIFQYVDVQGLKSFRCSCSSANTLVEASLPWAVNVCFVHDEKVHPRKHQYPEIPIEMTCIDDSVGWPNIRLRHFKSPFPAKKYFSIGSQKLAEKQFLKIKVLEIHDSALVWTDLLEAISCLPILRDLIYTHTKEYLLHNNVLKIMKGELNDHQDIAKAINRNQTKFKKLRSSKASSSKSLHTIKLQCLNLEITNFVLALLDKFCRDLKELDLIFSEGLFLEASSAGQPLPLRSLVDIPFPFLDASKLIHLNQESLTALRIVFLDERSHRRMGPFYQVNPNTVQIPVASILVPALWPRHEKLKLVELILEFPPAVTVQGSRMKYSNKTKEEIVICDNQLQGFYSFQLQHLCNFNLKTVNADNGQIDEFLLSAIPKKQVQTIFDQDKILIGKSMSCRKEPIQWDPMVVLKEKNVFYELNLYLDDMSIPYEKIFDQDMPVMENCHLLQIILVKYFPLKDFKIMRLVSRLPNLTRLALVNSLFRGPIQKYEDCPKITDFDMQSIVSSLPNLEVLVLQCNMCEVTDFGLAGITIEASKRMNLTQQYTILPDDRTGLPISNIKRLQVLELHGLGLKVTGVTAHFAFETCALEELYLFSPRFTKRQKKELKDKFALKKNFKIIAL